MSPGKPIVRFLIKLTGARLTPGKSIDNTLPGIHETAEFRPSAFHGLGETDASFRDGHTSLQPTH